MNFLPKHCTFIRVLDCRKYFLLLTKKCIWNVCKNLDCNMARIHHSNVNVSALKSQNCTVVTYDWKSKTLQIFISFLSTFQLFVLPGSLRVNCLVLFHFHLTPPLHSCISVFCIFVGALAHVWRWLIIQILLLQLDFSHITFEYAIKSESGDKICKCLCWIDSHTQTLAYSTYEW